VNEHVPKEVMRGVKCHESFYCCEVVSTASCQSTSPVYVLLVGVAQHVALGVEEVADRDRGREGSQVDFEIGGDVGAGNISRSHLATDFVEAGG
jgi:hypothetical protein